MLQGGDVPAHPGPVTQPGSFMRLRAQEYSCTETSLDFKQSAEEKEVAYSKPARMQPLVPVSPVRHYSIHRLTPMLSPQGRVTAKGDSSPEKPIMVQSRFRAAAGREAEAPCSPVLFALS